ncbi:MAG: N-acetyl-gamma-glutamyl-phosphate reductase [Actinobacteria bacterium]|nr:N-acetyl-gamma-glutamyl-phosphate reductase [Actinomycetota bacterium]MCL5886807.1 N-acetyl-gamma-glutamyl-phosphate reductase [Actinomycetota bacterium]
MIDVAVIGASGYTGIELSRILLGHPHFRLVAATSRAESGRLLSDVYPRLTHMTELRFEDLDMRTVAKRATLAFVALPHTQALTLVPELLSLGVTVVDLSADYRITDPEVYSQWYSTDHTSLELLSEAAYGLPELFRSSLSGARLVACPGCYPTATLLAAAPLLEAGLLLGDIVVVDAKSGVSGAGKSPAAGTHFPVANEAVCAYKVGSHRHVPEIEQQFSSLSGRSLQVAFTPHLVPMTRGLLSTVYLQLSRPLEQEEAFVLYQERYSEEHFITLCESGQMPSTSHVSGTNRAHIGLAAHPTGLLTVSCAIDNLIKGASGQAVQCANVLFGIDESAGLGFAGAVI